MKTHRGHTHFNAFVAVLLFSSVESHAQSGAHVYKKCVETLTGSAITFSDPNLQQLKNSSKEMGITRCLELLTRTALSPTTQKIIQRTDIAYSTQLDVFQTLNHFHRSWFSNSTLASQLNAVTDGVLNDNYQDAFAPGLLVSHSLFGGHPFSNVLKTKYTPEALRSNGASATNGPFSTLPMLPYLKQNLRMTQADGSCIPFNPTFEQTGTLEGIALIDESHPKYQEGATVNGWPGTSTFADSLFTIPAVGLSGVAIQRPFFWNRTESNTAGILALQSFVMSHFGRPQRQPMDGRANLPRRLGVAVMKDLLCQSGPYLQPNDVTQVVANFLSANDEPQAFQTNTQCQQCHATIDSISGVYRNLTYWGINAPACFTINNQFFNGVTMATYLSDNTTIAAPQTPGQQTRWQDAYPPHYHVNRGQFNRSPPTGRLYFRSPVTGELVNRTVDHVADLSEAILETNDFYVCAAKRYFEFMTHKKPSLFDGVEVTDPDEQRVNQFVLNAGLSLKNHQSLKQLIEDIVRSEFFGVAP